MSVGEDTEKVEPSNTAGGEQEMIQSLWNTSAVPQKVKHRHIINPAILFFRPRNSIHPHTNLHMSIHSSIIYNSGKKQTTEIFSN